MNQDEIDLLFSMLYRLDNHLEVHGRGNKNIAMEIIQKLNKSGFRGTK